MKKIILLAFVLVCQLVPLFGQGLSNLKMGLLPNQIDKNSGMIASPDGATIWAHNSKGDKPKLYKIDTLGNILRTVNLTNGNNMDWGDMTSDGLGSFYIGDFGNDANDRTDLKIYKIPHPDSLLQDTVLAEVISFIYLNQSDFPAVGKYKNFDVQAMVAVEDSLFLFTKNQTDPFDGWVRMYGISTTPGNYQIAPLDSFQTGTSAMTYNWITSASLSFKQQYFVMISNAYLWRFEDFPQNRFFQGGMKKYSLNEWSPKNAISFIDSTHLYLSDQTDTTIGRQAMLYKLDLMDINAGSSLAILGQETNVFCQLYPNPATNEIHFANVPNEKAEVHIYEQTGKCIFSKKEIPSQISLENWANGLYFVQFVTANGQIYHSKFCISRP